MWEIVSAVATACAAVVALALGVRAEWLRRAEARAAADARRDEYHLDLIRQIADVYAGRFTVSRSDLTSGSKELLSAWHAVDRVRQYRAEVRLPALIDALPRRYGVLLRFSEAIGSTRADRPQLSPSEWGQLMDWHTYQEKMGGRGLKLYDEIALEYLTRLQGHISTGAPLSPPEMPKSKSAAEGAQRADG